MRARTLLLAGTALAAAGAGSSAHAAEQSTICLQAGSGEPLRRVYVQHWGTDYRTNEGGCVTINAGGKLDLRVFAHNPVIRMDDGQNFTLPVSQEVKGVSDGETVSIPAQRNFWRKAEKTRQAYNTGLREFAPWQAEFPAGTKREPSLADYGANRGILRTSFPDQSVAVRSWVEGAALTTGFGFAFTGFPLVHLKADADDETLAHELGHALHFSKLSNSKRIALEASYGDFLLHDQEKTHCFDTRTTPTVAWIEAFGFFAGKYAGTPGQGAAKQRAFFKAMEGRRADLLDGESGAPCDNNPESGPMFGADVEGAVFLTLFHDFARSPEVGLPLVVENFVTCESTTVSEFGACVRQRYGNDSRVYAALVCAGSRYGINFPGGSPAIAGGAEAHDRFGSATATGDFNGDGIQDLAVGTPSEAIGDVAGAGMVSVIYGRTGGLGGMCNQAFTQDTAWIPGVVETGDHFGQALAAGDFNGDGFTDLAIGIPDEDIGDETDAGDVLLIPGAGHGLDFQGVAAIWKDGQAGRGGVARAGDRFGVALAAGNFNGISSHELAIGVPGQDASLGIVGAVVVLQSPLATEPTSRLVLQPVTPEPNDRFGTALAAGDFDGDGRDDLAVAAPGETVNGAFFAGAVSLIHGSAGGLSTLQSRHFVQGEGGIAGTAAASDEFGSSLAFGDFDRDGRADLAIGVPGEDVAAAAGAGGVAVIYGAPRASTDLRNQLWTQDAAGVAEEAEFNDRFGRAIVAADFNGDQHADLAIGTAGEDLGDHANAGVVVVLSGAAARPASLVQLPGGQTVLVAPRPAGLTGQGSLLLLAPDGAAGNSFGASLVAADFTGDGRSELVVGSPGKDVGSELQVGSVRVFRGSATGLSSTGTQEWRQDL